VTYDPARRSSLLRRFQEYRITVPEGEELLGYLREDIERVRGQNRPSDVALLGGVMTSLAAYISALRTTDVVASMNRRARVA
jgi:hypothetical protein